jgi:UDP-glucose 4-epimerase
LKIKHLYKYIHNINIFLMSILITGHKGYIGSHLYEYLIKYNTVYGVDIDDFDLKDYNKLHIFVNNKNIETIIHLASYKDLNESIENPITYYENNILITLNILKVIQEYNIKHLIFSSSASILNVDKTITNIDKLTNPYAKTKLICEEMIKDTAITNNFTYTILRYFNPYGFTLDVDIVPFIEKNTNIFFKVQHHLWIDNKSPFKVYGNTYNTRDGTCIRDYIFIDDLVKEHSKYINQNKNNIVNIGTGKGMTVLEFLKMYNITNYIIVDKRHSDIDISIC